MSGLERFVTAQDGVYREALGELRDGRKRSHWMWFVFPQIAGLGMSPTAQHYAIRDRAEAQAYLAHPVLGPRLIESVEAMLGWAGQRSAVAILGETDAMKLRSCCTLFEVAGGAGSPVFAACLDGFFEGRRDAATIRLLG